jgi:hypothetical protein
MNHEKIIKHNQGKLTIHVSLWITKNEWETDINDNKFRYDINTTLTPKGKRKPLTGNYNHLLTEDQIKEVKNEFWLKIKP